MKNLDEMLKKTTSYINVEEDQIARRKEAKASALSTRQKEGRPNLSLDLLPALKEPD